MTVFFLLFEHPSSTPPPPSLSFVSSPQHHCWINDVQPALIPKDRKVRIKAVVMETTPACFHPQIDGVGSGGGLDVVRRTPSLIRHSGADPIILRTTGSRIPG